MITLDASANSPVTGPLRTFVRPNRYKASIVYYFVFTVLAGMVVISLFIGVISLSMFKAFDDLQEEKTRKVIF